MTKELRALTDKEEEFVKIFATNGYKRAEAVRDAGYQSKDPSTLAYEILKRPAVQNALAIEKEKKRRYLMIDEMDVIEGLHDEATNEGARPSERIQAWVHIGKHFGMFQPLPQVDDKDEKDKGGITIINYNDPEFKTKQIVEETVEEVGDLSPEEAEKLAKLVNITDYADNDTV